MPSVRQTSFAGGELAPALYARSDIARYANGVRRCSNFFVTQHGALMNRPGLKFVKETKTSFLPCRLIPFVFSADESYVLEFGSLYMRIHTRGQNIVNGGTGLPLEITTPYVSGDVGRLKFAQLGNTMTIVHPGYAPRELKRIAPDNWVLSTINFAATSLSSPSSLVRFNGGVPNATHPVKNWLYKITEIYEDSSGVTHETAPYTLGFFASNWLVGTTYAAGDMALVSGQVYTSLQNGNIGHTPIGGLGDVWWGRGVVAYTDMPLSLQIVFAASPSNPISVNIYKGKGDVFGFIGSANPNVDTTFLDDGIAPDYTIVPPESENPFAIPGGGFQYPGAVTFFEQRRIFARTDGNPQTIFISATGEYANFDDLDFPLDSSAVIVTIASQQLDEIRSLVSHRSLLVMTQSGEWTLGGDAGPVTPNNIGVRLHSRRGSNYLDPLVVGNAILYVQDKGNSIRDFIFDVRSDSYGGNDLSLLAPHLFPKTTDLGLLDPVSNIPTSSGGIEFSQDIVSWAYSAKPHSVVWMIRSDGALLGLTYDREQEVLAWHQHSTDGLFEQVCVVPEEGEDAVYFVVNRTVNGVTKRYVERMASRLALSDQRLMCFLDCANTWGNGPAATVFTLAPSLIGKTVWALADGNVVGPLVVSGANQVTLPQAATTVTIGLPYNCEVEMLDLVVNTQEIRTKMKNVWKAVLEVADTRAMKAGEDFNHLHEVLIRRVLDQYGIIALYTGPTEVGITQSSNKGGRIVVRQSDPLPATILGITREIALGGD